MSGGKLLISCLRSSNKISQRFACHDTAYHYAKIGKREVVGYGLNGQPTYMDLEDFPMPAIRFREITPDLQVLKDKEKGDWKKLTIDEKKALYRASFYQTFAELNAPTGRWKQTIGMTLVGISMALWLFVALKTFVYPPLPITFDDEHRLAQLDRIRKLDVNPIWGINKRT